MYKPAVTIVAIFLLAVVPACRQSVAQPFPPESFRAPQPAEPFQPAKQNSGKLIHVLVALCDNQFQGIVPVPAKIGNGDDLVIQHDAAFRLVSDVAGVFQKLGFDLGQIVEGTPQIVQNGSLSLLLRLVDVAQQLPKAPGLARH